MQNGHEHPDWAQVGKKSMILSILEVYGEGEDITFLLKQITGMLSGQQLSIVC